MQTMEHNIEVENCKMDKIHIKILLPNFQNTSVLAKNKEVSS